MKLRHINCENNRCGICLNDANLLEDRLRNQTGTGNKYDLLGKYHSWLKLNKINPETEFGWFTEEVFKEENINNFCKSLLSNE